MAGIYYWYPKATGRMMNEWLGRLHFFGSFIFMNVLFMPMFFLGLAGVSRRLYDGGETYQFAQPVLKYNVISSWGAWMLAISQIPFIINFFWSLKAGKKVGANPWDATTIEWAAPSPPPHGNFTEPPQAYRGPYEYSLPGRKSDFLPQFERAEA
jgi:cytochrome c oxidase subunit 1